MPPHQKNRFPWRISICTESAWLHWLSSYQGQPRLTAPVAMAQTADTAASAPKQEQKAQRKADRKAARAKKNAELKDLEKNGYNPSGDQTNYPQNIQNAEKKSAAAKAKATSAPERRLELRLNEITRSRRVIFWAV